MCSKRQMLTSAEFPRDLFWDAMDRTLSEFCPESSPELVAILAQAGSKGSDSMMGLLILLCFFSFLSLSLPSHRSSPQRAKFHSGPVLKETKMASAGSQNWAVTFSEAASGVTSRPVCLREQPSRDPQVCVARVQLFCRETPFLLPGQTWWVFWQRTATAFPHQEYLYLHQSCLHALACLWNLFLLLHN